MRIKQQFIASSRGLAALGAAPGCSFVLSNVAEGIIEKAHVPASQADSWERAA